MGHQFERMSTGSNGLEKWLSFSSGKSKKNNKLGNHYLSGIAYWLLPFFKSLFVDQLVEVGCDTQNL